MTISTTIDIALLATSAATALYCATLSRRLRALQAGRGAMPVALDALTAAVRRSQDAAATVAAAAEAATARMTGAQHDLAEQRRATEDLCGLLDGQAARAQDRTRAIEEAADRAQERLTHLVERAHAELDALARAVEIFAGSSTTEANPTPITALPNVTRLPIEGPTVAPHRASRTANPFARAAR